VRFLAGLNPIGTAISHIDLKSLVALQVDAIVTIVEVRTICVTVTGIRQCRAPAVWRRCNGRGVEQISNGMDQSFEISVGSGARYSVVAAETANLVLSLCM